MGHEQDGPGDHRNPYAPSRASLAAGTLEVSASNSDSAWRESDTLVLRHQATLPARCVKCNAAAHEPTKKRKIYWHHWAIYLLILINIILYAIVAMIARKRAIVSPGLCARHKARRRNAIALGWLGSIAGFAILVAGLGEGEPLLGTFGVLLALVAAMAGVIVGRVVFAKRIDDDYVRLKGCGTAFLNTLPEFPG